MTTATNYFHNQIALVFDFDETLAPGTYPKLIESLVRWRWGERHARLFSLK